MSKLPNTILVIMGITGDLVGKKVAPALFDLYQKGELPEKFRLIGFGRKQFDAAGIRRFVTDLVLAKFPDADAGQLQAFTEMLDYQQGLFEEAASYERLKARLAQIQQPWGEANKLFYLAVPPEIYGGIFQHFQAVNLIDEHSRILVEKPFGSNAKSAQELDLLLGTLFAEERIYRIDHYLAKEMLQNILAFRFNNDLFEKSWDNQLIELIQIRLWEKIGVEHRGKFYDGVGALRDVGQNHLLQMLALVTMDYPVDFLPSALQARRTEILNQLKPLTPEQIRAQTYRAQYDGYQQIAGVAPDSQTETYFRFTTQLDSPKWAGVPVIFDGGKRLGEARKEIIITLRHPEDCNCPPGRHYRNRIIFALEPKEGIEIELWAKKPGLGNEVELRRLEFMLRQTAGRLQYIEEYQKLFIDAIRGDQTLFVSTSEVQAMWNFIDPIAAAWAQNIVPLKTYQPDTDQAPADSANII